MGVQVVRWDKGGTVSAGVILFSMEKKKKIIILEQDFFVHHGTVSAVTRIEFVSDRVSYIVLRGCWYNTVLNVHAPSEEKSDYSKDCFYEQVFDHFPKYHMKILVGDFNAKVRRGNIVKLTIRNESLHQDCNDNGVRIVDFTTSKNLVVKSTMFLHRNIHKYTWTSPDGMTHKQTDHILRDMETAFKFTRCTKFKGS